MTRRAFWIVLTLGAFLRLLLIWHAGLWYDENFSLLLSRLPFMRLLAATMGDVHPPLWYVLIWPLGRIPTLPPWAIRIPSALLSVASLALYPRLMRDLRIPGRVQLIAFVMLAILPMQLHYAQEARMYALLELLVILGTLAVLEGRAWLLGASVALMLYTQNYGAFYVATLALILAMLAIKEWWRDRSDRMAAVFSGEARNYLTVITYAAQAMLMRRRFIRLAIAMLIGVLLWLPWLPVMSRQMDFIQGNYWIFDMNAGAILYTIFHLFWAISLQTPAGNVAGMLVTFALLIAAVWYLIARRPTSWLILACLAFGPLLMAIVVSLVRQPIVLFRPLIGSTPFLYIVCAFPLAAIPDLRGRLLAACFIAPVLLIGVIGYYQYIPMQKTINGSGNMLAAINTIRDRWQPGDLILDGNGMGWVNITPYLTVPQYALPNCALKFPGGISPRTHDALQIQSRNLDELPPHKRIWFVAVVSPLAPACEVARIYTVTSGRKPYLTMDESPFLLSALWLLNE